MLVGILALQGDFFEHAQAVELIKKDYKLIKTVEDLLEIDAIILPGGESTAMNIIQKNLNSLFGKKFTRKWYRHAGLNRDC